VGGQKIEDREGERDRDRGTARDRKEKSLPHREKRSSRKIEIEIGAEKFCKEDSGRRSAWFSSCQDPLFPT
jgi:hypothetical protein